MAPGLGQLVRRAVTVQAVVALLLISVSVVLFAVSQRYEDDASRTRETLIDLQRLRGEVLSAETSLRGFALTLRTAFLAPYDTAVPRIDRYVAQIAGRLDRAERVREVRAIGARFSTWRTTFAEPVLASLRNGRDDAARADITSGRGKRHIDAIRLQIRRLTARERGSLARDEDRADRVGLFGIGAIGLLSLGVITALLLLRRRLLDEVVVPVQDLAAATERFGSGDHGARAAVTGVHEVRVTAHAFNEMAGELDRTVGELRELDELKSRFVSMVSHELRTPLTSIRGFVEELEEEDGDLAEHQREAVEIIARNAGHLEAIIDDLLLLSSLESGRVRLRLVDVQLAALLGELVRELTPAARTRDVTLELDVPADLAIRADPGRLRQACANLVSNAIKFSPTGATVAIRGAGTASGAIVEVVDHGPGIPADELSQLTERFFRASTSIGTSGTGLGLAITRELVQHHGGHLEIESTEGEGATFRIVLPADGAPQDGGGGTAAPQDGVGGV